jgi:perosamine synthetase
MSKLAIHGGTPVFRRNITLPSVIQDAERDAIKKVIDHGLLSAFRGGPEVKKFEQEFAKFIGVKYAVATTSGTTALHTSLASFDLKEGDEVLVPAVTFVSTASVALQEKLNVRFVDIDKYYCMDSIDLESKITSRSRAIIPVHLYGQPANMHKILRIASRYNLAIIEDACQSHGARLGNVYTGALGDIGCFSFYQTKNMTTGEGGMITTNSKKMYDQVLLRREHGSPRSSKTWYNYIKLGYNYNMTELQGAIGRAQLQKLNELNRGRIRNAELYDDALNDTELDLPKLRKGVIHVRHSYPVLLPKRYASKRDFFVKALQAEGIPVDVAYPSPLYATPLFSDQKNTARCPRSDDITSRLFTLFTDCAITPEIILATKEAIKKVMKYLDETI